MGISSNSQGNYFQTAEQSTFLIWGCTHGGEVLTNGLCVEALTDG